MNRDSRTYVACLAAVVALDLAALWVVDVVPGQDFPQHLAYAHILSSHARVEVFSSTYELPSTLRPYFVPHWVLAGAARVLPVGIALKILLSAYVIAFVLAFYALVVAVHASRSPWPPWTALLGGVLALGPPFVMGWLTHLVAAPAFLGGCAAYLTAAREGRPRADVLVALVACVALATSLHAVVAGVLVAFVILHALAAPRPRTAGLAAGVVVVAVLTLIGWSALAALDVPVPALDPGKGPAAILPSALRHMTYGEISARLGDIAAIVLGPFPPLAQAFVAAALAGLGVAVATSRRPVARRVDRPVVVAVALVAVASLAAPSSIVGPAILTLVDLRLTALSVCLAAALVPPRWFEARRTRWALITLAAALQVNTAARLVLLDRDLAPLRTLLAAAEPGKRLLPLVYHPGSRWFHTGYLMEQFASLQYTLERDGLDLQFWGRYSPHLPVAYRPGREPPRPSVAFPDSFVPEHLDHADYLLLAAPDAGDGPRAREGLERALLAARPRAGSSLCLARWCLLALRPPWR